MADNENDNSDESGVSMDFDDLTEEQKEAILQNPDVRKSLRYQDEAIQTANDGLTELQESDEDSELSEAFDLLVSGIAERSGRVTESTVRKVLEGFTAEVMDVTDSE